jgi:hypothetical protein
MRSLKKPKVIADELPKEKHEFPKLFTIAKDLQLELNCVKEKAKEAFFDYLGSFKPFDLAIWEESKEFYYGVKCFKEIYASKERYQDNLSEALDEFVRLQLGSDTPKVDYEDAIKFLVTWNDITKRLYDPLFDVIEGCGDDGYGDYLDILPLAGEKVIARALVGAYKDHKKLFSDVYTSVRQEDPDDIFIKLIEGENYFSSTLEKSLKTFFYSYCRSYYDEVELEIGKD